MRALSRMRFGNSKKDDEVTKKVEEKEKENSIENGAISPSLIPKFSGARHSPRKRITTFGSSPLTRIMNKVSLEINKIELSNITSNDRQIDCIFCTLRVGSDREISFSSSLITKRNNNIIFSFSINETVLRDISMNEYSARYALLSIKSTNEDGSLLGEASISLRTNAQDPSSRHKIGVLKDRKRVGGAYYSLSRPVEGFLDDSASEDGDQASATPSPFTKLSPMQLAIHASPVVTTLDLSDSPATVSVHKLLQSPNSPVRTLRISGNAKTLLAMQNLTTHNRTASINSIPLSTIENELTLPSNIETEKQLVSKNNQTEVDDYLAPKEEVPNQNDDNHNLPVSPILPQRSPSNEMFLSPIAFPSPCKPESTGPTVEENDVKQETPVAVMLTTALESEDHCLETLPRTSPKDTTVTTDSTNQILLDYSPVVVSLVPSTSMTQRDTAHDPLATSTTNTATVTVVSATPSMTVLGSVNRLQLRQQLRRQKHQQNSECITTPFSPGTDSSNNINNNSTKCSNNSVHGSVRRTLAQVKERLQRLQPTPSTVDVEGISCSIVNETSLSCMESSSKRIRRRLSLMSNSTVSPVPAESITSTPDIIINETDNNIKKQDNETFSLPAMCLLDELVDETPVKDSQEKEITKEFSLFEQKESFEADYEAINDCMDKKLAILANNTDYFYDVNTSNKREKNRDYFWTKIMLPVLAILTMFATTTVIGNTVYGMADNNMTVNTKPSVQGVSSTKGVSFQFPVSSSSNIFMHTDIKEEFSFSLSVQLQVLKSSISTRKNINNNDHEDTSPVCLHWISSLKQPSSKVIPPQVTSLTKKSTNNNTNKIWYRMKTWFQNFTKRLQSRFKSSKKLKSLPSHSLNANNNNNNNVVESVQGIVRMGDCPSVLSGRENPSSWQLRPTAKSTTLFHLQYVGPLSSAVMSIPQAWCLSVTPAFTSELRPCDAANATNWRFVDNLLSAEIHGHNNEDNSGGYYDSNNVKKKETVELNWQWNAQYSTNALVFQKQQANDTHRIEIGMLTWLPLENIQETSNMIQYQRQRIDSIV